MKVSCTPKNEPKNWRKVRLSECILQKPDYGINAPAVPFASDLPAYLRITDISEDGKFIYDKKVSVKNSRWKDYLLKKNDVVFARTGASVGKTYRYNEREGELVFAGFLIRVRPDLKKINPSFLEGVTRLGRYWQWVKENSARSGQPGINSNQYANFSFSLPPLPEQNRIVAVLETWDQAIEKLTKKIEMKKNIKKGLMRELLTGKKRLPEFFEKWEIIKLGNFGKLLSGGTPSKRKSEYWSGNIPWISSSDLIDDDIRHVYIHRYITEQAVTGSATGVVPKYSIIIVSRVGVGKLIVNDIDLCTSQDFQSLILNRGAGDPYFLAYKLCIELQKLSLRNQGTSIKGFLKKDLECLQILTPKIEEQRVIADILTAADEELSLLKKKLEKLKDQKRYLLNNLLTGTIRTPESLLVQK